MPTSQHLAELKKVIRHLHKCEAEHLESVPVHETFRGETVWDGVVEVFAITGHTRATKCYAWRYMQADAERCAAILEVPPVKSAADAVKVSIIAANKKLFS